MLKIAIPKSINTEKCLQHFRAVGIDNSVQDDCKVLTSKKFPAEVRRMNDAEIIKAVAVGAQDIGVVLQHQVVESAAKVKCVHSFSAYKKNLSLFIYKELRYKNVESLTGKRIATPFPHIVANFLKLKNIKANIISCEDIECVAELGMADGICTVFNSKLSCLETQLREIEIVMPTFPIIIANENLSAQKQMILEELIERIVSVQNADGKKMIYISALLKNKNAVIQALAQAESPIMEISVDNERMIFQCILDEKRFWDIKAHLQFIGAEIIFVLPVESIIK
jgi:ATP phosphoribosyltransferase